MYFASIAAIGAISFLNVFYQIYLPTEFYCKFIRIPQPTTSEYWIHFYDIIASTIVGWSISSIIAWTRSKGDVRN